MGDFETLFLEYQKISFEKETSSFCLPGAEKFSEFLLEKCARFGKLSLRGPFEDRAIYIGHPSTERHDVFLEEIYLGSFYMGFLRQDNEKFNVIYHGRIPGLINKCLVEGNKELIRCGEQPYKHFDSFFLEYSSLSSLFIDDGKLEFKRTDRHFNIPFP